MKPTAPDSATVVTLRDPHFRRALAYVQPYIGKLVPVVVVSLLSTGLSLVLPYLSKLLIDDALTAPFDRPLLFELVGLLLLIPLVTFGLNVFSGMRYTKVSADILFDMRLVLYRQLQRLSPRFYARTPLGDIVSRINGDIGEIQRVISEAALAWFGQVVALVGTIVMLVILDWRLFVASVLVLPPSLLALVWYRQRLEGRVRTMRERSADIGSFLIETLQGMGTIVGANAQDREITRFRDRNDRFVDALLSMRLFTYLAGGAPGLLITAGGSVVFLYGGVRVIDGAMTLGTFIAFMAYQARLMSPVQGLMGIYTNLATARASLVRVHELLDTPPDVVEAESPEHFPGDGRAPSGALRFEDVHLDFGRGEAGLIGIDLEIPAGQRLAIVGASGSGKSTIAALLSRQIDPEQGRVYLDDIELRSLPLATVRDAVAVVAQAPFIFHASVADNIRYGRPEASDTDVLDAARAAGLEPLLERMPDGVATVVGERGAQLSAGERQRLAIARAFIADPVVIVMDEATGALDPSSEAAVLDGYERILRGRTTVLITHRLDLARQAERVVVIEDGRVREDGPPSELEATGRVFRNLFLDVLKG